jgi:hypothetical protein
MPEIERLARPARDRKLSEEIFRIRKDMSLANSSALPFWTECNIALNRRTEVPGFSVLEGRIAAN